MTDREQQTKPTGLTPLNRVEVTHDAPTVDLPAALDIRRLKTNPPPDDLAPFYGRWWSKLMRILRRR